MQKPNFAKLINIFYSTAPYFSHDLPLDPIRHLHATNNTWINLSPSYTTLQIGLACVHQVQMREAHEMPHWRRHKGNCVSVNYCINIEISVVVSELKLLEEPGSVPVLSFRRFLSFYSIQ